MSKHKAHQPDAAQASDEHRRTQSVGESHHQAPAQPEANEVEMPGADEQMTALRNDLDAAQNRLLRSQAELENFRKRIAREREDERRYANLALMRDLLPVLDNMDRAIAAAENTHNTADLLEGVKMISRQLTDVLQRYGCEPIDAQGQPFDPHWHDAILQQPSAEHPPGTVVQVTQPGFRLHDRVVRPSQVIVSAAVEESEQPQEEENEPSNER